MNGLEHLPWTAEPDPLDWKERGWRHPHSIRIVDCNRDHIGGFRLKVGSKPTENGLTIEQGERLVAWLNGQAP